MSAYDKSVGLIPIISPLYVYTFFGYKLKNLQRCLLNPVCILKACKLFKMLLYFFVCLLFVFS